MRYALLLLFAAACARDSWPDGRYLYVQGDTAGIKFDHVELFFGGHITNFLPHGIPKYTKPAGVTEALKRRLAVDASGVQAIADAPVAHVDLGLPAELADGFGEYVMVIAYAGTTPVGIGARKDFAAAPKDITRYEIALEPVPSDPATFYRWGIDGDGPNCVRWQHDGEVVAVVRVDDIDCDGYLDYQVDCDQLTYCEGDCASADLAPCADNAGCVLGRCTNSRASGAPSRTCEPEVCLANGACLASCDGDTPAERFSCQLGEAHDGGDTALPLNSARALCTTPEPYPIYFDLPDGYSCIAQTGVLAYGVDSGTALAYTLTVIPLPMPVPVGNAVPECEVKMVENIHVAGMPPTVDEVFHFLLPLKNALGQDTSSIVGFMPAPGACDTSVAPELVVPIEVDKVATCGP